MKVGVVLAGCGVFDGAEIHESVITLLALHRAGAEVQCYAPDMEQHHVVNHLTGDEMDEKRNVLVEAARIARGEIKNLAEAQADALDALVVPGGFGAAKNLCTFALEGSGGTVNAEVKRILTDMRAAGKPIGLACAAPLAGVLVFASSGVEVTVGSDPDTAAEIEKTGAKHVSKSATEIHIDEAHNLVTTPAYYAAQNIGEVADGINKLVDEVLRRAKGQA